MQMSAVNRTLDSVVFPRTAGIGAELPMRQRTAGGSGGEGCRMSAGHELSIRAEGRRPKASREGTRGGRRGRWPSMAI